jgi:hypothetical protein
MLNQCNHYKLKYLEVLLLILELILLEERRLDINSRHQWTNHKRVEYLIFNKHKYYNSHKLIWEDRDHKL